MSEQNHEVTIHELPEGTLWGARFLEVQADSLRLELEPSSNGRRFPIGVAVEVQDAERIYLGQVRGQEERRLLIGIEHLLDRKALAEIESVWQPVARGGRA